MGHMGASWVLQLLVGTCSSAGCIAALEAAWVNYSEMEIDLQHHTQINPPSLWNYHYTVVLLRSNQSSWCTALRLKSEGLPCTRSVRWCREQQVEGEIAKKKSLRRLQSGVEYLFPVGEGTCRRREADVFYLMCEIKASEHLAAHLAILHIFPLNSSLVFRNCFSLSFCEAFLCKAQSPATQASCL